MRLVDASVELLDDRGFSGVQILEKLERVGRVCYKSEDKIKEGSAEKMVKALLKSKHEAIVEHWSYILMMEESLYNSFVGVLRCLEEHGYKLYLRRTAFDGRYIVSGNVRAWRDFIRYSFEDLDGVPRWFVSLFNSEDIDKKVLFGDLLGKYPESIMLPTDVWFLDKEDLTDIEKKVHYDITVKFICDRGVSHEIVRHRDASFAQESTRYCNYGKADEITVIKPLYLSEPLGEPNIHCTEDMKWLNWYNLMHFAQDCYMGMLDEGAIPQEARAVLPNSLKTELVMTANVKEWIHFLRLRAFNMTGAAHPQMREVALKVYDIYKEMFPSLFGDIYEC